MEYITKRLGNTLAVTGIVNLHFFEFDKDFETVGERHPFYELVYVNTGKLYIESEDFTGLLFKNQAIIHRENSIHSLKCITETRPSVIIIGFECDSEIIDSFSLSPITLDRLAIEKIAEVVKEGRNVFVPPYNIPTHNMKKKKDQIYGSEQMLRIMLENFLIHIIRVEGFGKKDETPSKKLTAISEIKKYVDDNFLEKMTIDELAFLFHTNRATLCKEFKDSTGCTLVEYVNGKRFDEASRRIRESEDSITRIAEEMKFESIHYFTRFFKKMSGMTPSEYRKENT